MRVPEPVMREIMIGMGLTSSEVAALEQTLQSDPLDLAIRAQVIGFYTSAMGASEYSASSPAGQQVIRHVLWLIENAPEAELAGSMYGFFDDQGEHSAAAEALWRKQLEARPDDPCILTHAARFFQLRKPEVAQDLIARARQVDPAGEWQLHELSKPGRSRPMRTESPPATPSDPIDPILERFYALGTLVIRAVNREDYDGAEALALELLSVASQFQRNWSYGNAIYSAHHVLGRIALARGDLDSARSRLLQAAETPGSPQLNSFGPTMVLAQALLDRGETEVVLQFFERCHNFWALGHGRLDAWSEDVRSGRNPTFGPNLLYGR